MRRIIMAVAFIVATTACTDTQLAWWANAEPEDQQAVAERIVRDAAAEYGVDGDLLVRIARCESGLRPWAYNPSGASGLMQHMKQFWPSRAAAIGEPDASVFDPVANARAGAMMLANDPSGGPWYPSRHCWGR